MKVARGRIKRPEKKSYPIKASEKAYVYITEKAVEKKHDRIEALDRICERDSLK
jgi:hypothetical protein